jgi:hypothetical protein
MPDPTFRQKHEWARAHQSLETVAQGRRHGCRRWRQRYSWRRRNENGGRPSRCPMILTGGSDTVQGLTMMWDAIKGRESEGWNPEKRWGAMRPGFST